MVKDVKMCKSAGKKAHVYHGKKQKGFKKLPQKHQKDAALGKGASYPQNINSLCPSIRARCTNPRCKLPPRKAVPTYRLI
jgi:hypothetical protein